MNNSELEKKLKAAREPALEVDYKEAFPQIVLANLHRPPSRYATPERQWVPRLVWGLGTAICILTAFYIGHWRGHREAGNDVLADSKVVQETLTLFPNRVRAIVHDEHGMNLVLSDNPDVPVSTPIYVRICDGKQCTSLVTFSGQDVQIAGQTLTVLSEADGGIILEGKHFIWSNNEPIYSQKNLKIEAKNLGMVAM